MTLGFRIALIVAATAGLIGTGFAGTALAQNPHSRPPVVSKVQMPGGPMGSHDLMADMRAEQQKLDDLVAAMNAATGAEKVDRIAAVVAELAARQQRMFFRMMTMTTMQNEMREMHHPATPPAPEPPAAPKDGYGH